MKYFISGIYDQRSFNALKEIGISHFSFDFRPTSFNFFQQYRFMDLIQKCYSSKDIYFLHFAGEADFVVQKFIDDLKNELGALKDKNIFLEFSDFCPPNYYNGFDLPYYLHYSEELKLQNFSDAGNLKGMIFNFLDLYEMKQKGSLYSFVKNFFQLTAHMNLELILNVDWDANIFPSLTELFDFDGISLPINSKVEVCYRNVDLTKLKLNLGIFKSEFGI